MLVHTWVRRTSAPGEGWAQHRVPDSPFAPGWLLSILPQCHGYQEGLSLSPSSEEPSSAVLPGGRRISPHVGQGWSWLVPNTARLPLHRAVLEQGWCCDPPTHPTSRAQAG